MESRVPVDTIHIRYHACFKLTIGIGLLKKRTFRLTIVITSYRVDDDLSDSSVSPRARTAKGFGNETSLPSRW